MSALALAHVEVLLQVPEFVRICSLARNLEV